MGVRRKRTVLTQIRPEALLANTTDIRVVRRKRTVENPANTAVRCVIKQSLFMNVTYMELHIVREDVSENSIATENARTPPTTVYILLLRRITDIGRHTELPV